MKQVKVKLVDHKANVSISDMIDMLTEKRDALVEQGIGADDIFVSTGMFGEIRLCYLGSTCHVKS